MSSCIFCRIVEGAIPAKIVYRDDKALAFEDINPQAPVHLLIIPKRHIASVQDCQEIDESLLGHLLLTSVKVAGMKQVVESGYRIVTNVGRDSGQTVFHLHVHVLGGRHLGWPPG
ncbi:MAG TPA: histidine triad nucleotide-binding protein [Nitrospiraceae bacterium]|nr:histidine triad nucleotide-binding protein [Nitrospiraceae bacterium]